jgi:hypothetical protein
MSKDIVQGMPPKVKEFAAGFWSPGLQSEGDFIVLTDTLEEGLRIKKMWARC